MQRGIHDGSHPFFPQQHEEFYSEPGRIPFSMRQGRAAEGEAGCVSGDLRAVERASAFVCYASYRV